jgi:hypothetical protein
MLQMLDADWREHGAEVLERVRERWPQVYLTACISLLPKQQTIEKLSPLDHLSDDELDLVEQVLKSNRAKLVQQIEAVAIEHESAAEPVIELEPQDATTGKN